MKKLYALLLLSFVAFQGFAQTVTVNATGAPGSFKTGNVYAYNTPVLHDDAIEVKYNASTGATAGNRRGWMVFNLAGVVPPGATVTAVNLRFVIASTVNALNPTCTINAYAGDMSTITNAATVNTNCNIAANICNSSTWGGAAATITRAFNAYGISFVNTSAASGSTISFGLNSTASASQIYYITGYSGSTALQPQLQITYSCTGVTGVTANSSANPICLGSSFTLSGTATGAGSYLWTGPSGYTSTDLNPPAPISGTAAAAGTYTLTAFYPGVGGCSVTATRTLTTSVSPTAITGNLSPCAATTTALGSTPATGTWSINSTSGATLAGNVVTAGSASGATTVTYTLPSGCNVTAPITTLDTPAALSLASYYCAGTPATLTGSPAGGTWMVNPASVAAIDATTGILTGAATGTVNITYTGANGCKTSKASQMYSPPSSVITSSSGSLHICPSLSFTLSNAVPGGAWTASGGNVTINGSTGQVSAISLGTSDITYSNTCGIATATVYVDPPPPPITGTFSTCVNAVSVLHNAEAGGVWSSNSPSVALTAAGFGSVTGVGAGTLTITYTAVTGCTATTPFTVNPIPAPITGTASVCPGFSVSLSDTSTGATWSSADTNIAKINTVGLVSGIAAATTTITYTYNATGCYNTRSFTVNPLPVAITGTGAFCATTADTLYNLSLGGTWSSGSTGIAVVNSSGIVTGIAGGTSNITYTLPTGCYRVRAITVRPLPNPVITYNFFTETLSTGTFYTSYQWYQGGVAIPGANSYNLAATDPNFYTVYVTDTFGCEKMSAPKTITAVGVNQVDLSQSIKVLPNPTTGSITITSPVTVKAVITSLDGKVVAEQINARNMDISNLSTGMYVIMLFDDAGNRVAVQKLIKE